MGCGGDGMAPKGCFQMIQKQKERTVPCLVINLICLKGFLAANRRTEMKKRVILSVALILLLQLLWNTFSQSISAHSFEENVLERSITPLEKEPDNFPISSFDVNSDGFVIMGFSKTGKGMAVVYSPQMEFVRGFEFNSSGSFCVLWDGPHICIYYVRGETFAFFDTGGSCIKLVTKNSDQTYFSELLAKTFVTKKVVNGITYQLKNDLLIGGDFGKLIMVDPNGNETVFYDANLRHYARVLGGSICVVTWFAFAIYFVYSRKIKRQCNKKSFF